MTAIAFTSARYKSMADNSLQATITIEPKDALAFVRLFGAAGTPGAVARLTPEAALKDAQQEALQELADQAQALQMGYPAQEDGGKEEKSSVGPLCKWSVMRCQEPEFQRFILSLVPERIRGDEAPSEEQAKNYICVLCDIESRKELDTSPSAARLFQDQIMKLWSRSPLNPHRERV